MFYLSLVALGGALGSVLRYCVTRMSVTMFGAGFPWGTVIVNLVGSSLIGLLTALIINKADNPEPLRLLLITGFLGGFTTFSAFSLDVLDLIARGAHLQAASYVLISVLPAIFATFLGLAIGRSLL
jgi:CrcB protein